MKREDVAVVAQLLTSMKIAVEKLEKAIKENDKDSINITKREIIALQENLAKSI